MISCGSQGAPARPPGRRACGPGPWSSWPRSTATRACPTHRRARSSPAGSSRPPTPARWSATWRPSRTPSGVMQTPEALARVAAECAEDLAADGVVYAEVRYAPELHVDARAGAAGGRRGRQRGLPRGRAARPRPPVRRSGSARCSPRCGTPPGRWRSPSSRSATATTGVVGLRHRRRRGRLPADPAPGRVRVPPAGERPLHDPRRRGLRAAVDLAGDPVVRRRPARPRRADHRRHHRRARRRGRALGPARGLRARQADPAGDGADVQRDDRRGRSPSRSTRSGCCAGCTSGSRSTPTTG